MNPFSYEAAIDACRQIVKHTKENGVRPSLAVACAAAHAALMIDRQPQEWRVLVLVTIAEWNATTWQDCGRGPWESAFEAEVFARHEITGPFRVCCVIRELSRE